MSIEIDLQKLANQPNIWHDLKLRSFYENKSLIFKDSVVLCDNWDTLFEYLEKVRLPTISNNWIFRGSNNYKNTLSTSLERVIKNQNDRYNNYVKLFLEFKSAAHNFLEINQLPEPDDILEWEALMQHHGCPTRLLDWTDSPYIATFFAINELNDSEKDCEHSCIWCLNESLFTSMCLNEFNIRNLKFMIPNFNVKLFNQKGVFDIIHMEALNQANWGFILPIKPKRKNMRLLSQQGSFTLFGNIRHDFEYNLNTLLKNNKNNKSYNLIKMIIIPHSLKDKIMSYLFSANITKRTLFPGIDGFSQSLIQYIMHDDYKIKKSDQWFSIYGKIPFKSN